MSHRDQRVTHAGSELRHSQGAAVRNARAAINDLENPPGPGAGGGPSHSSFAPLAFSRSRQQISGPDDETSAGASPRRK